jgi:hypothetical protein
VTRLGSSQYLKDLAISMTRRIQDVFEGAQKLPLIVYMRPSLENIGKLTFDMFYAFFITYCIIVAPYVI